MTPIWIIGKSWLPDAFESRKTMAQCTASCWNRLNGQPLLDGFPLKQMELHLSSYLEPNLTHFCWPLAVPIYWPWKWLTPWSRCWLAERLKPNCLWHLRPCHFDSLEPSARSTARRPRPHRQGLMWGDPVPVRRRKRCPSLEEKWWGTPWSFWLCNSHWMLEAAGERVPPTIYAGSQLVSRNPRKTCLEVPHEVKKVKEVPLDKAWSPSCWSPVVNHNNFTFGEPTSCWYYHNMRSRNRACV